MRLRHNVLHLIRNRELMLIHCFFTSILLIGLTDYSGTRYLHFVFSYLGSFLFVSWLLHRYFKTGNLKAPSHFKLNLNWEAKFQKLLLFSSFIFIGIHFASIGEIPIYECWQKTDILETARLRQSITEDGTTWINYGSSFLVKGFLPFILLMLLIQKDWFWFVLMLFVSLFYEINLLQKNYFLLLLSPVILYSLFQRKWIQAGVLSFLVVLGVYGLIYASNPELRGIQPSKDNKTEIKLNPKDEFKSFQAGSSGIINRILIVPGKVVGLWFNNIPSKYPFLYGNGYSFVAKFRHVPLVEYSNDLYAELYPQYAADGLRGSVNTASFMYDYANFGFGGLLLSGVVMAFWLFLLQGLFPSVKILFILNLFPIVMLTSTSLLTLLFSGGWLLTVLLFLLFKRKFNTVL
jgi:hypothetical protein